MLYKLTLDFYKYVPLVVTISIPFQLLGLVIIGIGAYVIIELEYFNTAAFVILGLGIVVVLTAALGSLGAAHESSQISKTVSKFSH